ncbi:MAG: hypothetical protein QHC90_11940 [Shinella sp.]|nr:hypothetical protein [Shinella sp.]
MIDARFPMPFCGFFRVAPIAGALPPVRRGVVDVPVRGLISIFTN